MAAGATAAPRRLMSVERATGVVLRVRPLTETSLIVHWLTAEFGRIATVAKGARRPKSPFRGQLDLYFDAGFSFQRSRRSDLHTLRELVLLNPRAALRTDLAALRRAAYATFLVEKATETETPLPTLHARLREFLDHAAGPAHVLAFELQVLEDCGLAPDLDGSRLGTAARQAAVRLRETPVAAAATLDVTTVVLRELSQFLHGFLVYHLGGLPRGRAAALQELPEALPPATASSGSKRPVPP